MNALCVPSAKDAHPGQTGSAGLWQMHGILYFLYPLFLPEAKEAPLCLQFHRERSKCTLEKSFYRANAAQNGYDTLKSESRSGFAVSEAELAHLDSIVSPLLRNGQSLHHIAVSHEDETMVSERSLYTVTGCTVKTHFLLSIISYFSRPVNPRF